jgi:hypothetical protein
MHTVEQRSCSGLTDRHADIDGAASDLGFDGVERGDALDRFGRGGRGMCDVDLVELAPGVRPAGDFDDHSTFIKMLEAGVGIGLERTLVEL